MASSNATVGKKNQESPAQAVTEFAPPPPRTEFAQLPGVTGKPTVDVNTAYHNMANECSAKNACGCQKEKITDKHMLDMLERGYTEQNLEDVKLMEAESNLCDPKSVQRVIVSRFHPSTMALASMGDKNAIAHIAPMWAQLQKECDNQLKYSDLAPAPPVMPANV